MSNTGQKVRAIFLAALMVISVFGMTAAFAGSAAAVQDNVTLHDSAQGTDITGTVAQDGETVYVKADVSGSTTSGGTAQVDVDSPNGAAITVTVYDDGSGPDNTADDGIYWGSFTISSGSSDDANEVIGVDDTNDATVTSNVDGDTAGTASITADYTAPTFQTVETLDTDDDGNVDAANIVMSEAIDDATLTDSDFTIGGVTANGISTNTLNDDGTNADTNANNDRFSITLTQANSVEGTDAKQVTYTQGGLADLAGNQAPSLAEGDLDETDGAAPVLTSLKTSDPDVFTEGLNVDGVVAVFSEGVNVGSNAIVAADLNGQYTDTGGQGATTINSVGHTAGERVAVLTMDNDIVAGDIDTPDTLSISDTNVQDAAGNAAVDQGDAGGDSPTDLSAGLIDLTDGPDTTGFVSPTTAGDTFYVNTQLSDVDGATVTATDATTTKTLSDIDDDSTEIEAEFAAVVDDQQTTGTDESSVTVSVNDVNIGLYDYFANYNVVVDPVNVTFGATETIEGDIYRAPGVLADDANINYALLFADSGGAIQPGDVTIADSDTSNGQFIVTKTFDVLDDGDENYLRDYPDNDGNGPAIGVVVNRGSSPSSNYDFTDDDGYAVINSRLDVTFNPNPSDLEYGETTDVTGQVNDTNGAVSGYEVSLQDPGGSAVKVTDTAVNGEYGFTVAMNDAGAWDFVTNEGGEITYASQEVGAQTANVDLSTPDQNIANFEHEYTVQLNDSRTDDPIDTLDAVYDADPNDGVEGYVNVTGEFSSVTNNADIIGDPQNPDGDANVEYFHVRTDAQGQATFTATLAEATDMTATLEYDQDDDPASHDGQHAGLEVDNDAADTPDSPDYVGSDTIPAVVGDDVNVINWDVEDPATEQFDGADDNTQVGQPFDTTKTKQAGSIYNDDGPEVIEVLPLQETAGRDRVQLGQRIGFDQNQNLQEITAYRVSFELVDENNQPIRPGTTEGTLKHINISGAGIAGGISKTADDTTLDSSNIRSDSTRIVDVTEQTGDMRQGVYSVVIRPTEVTDYPKNLTVEMSVEGADPVTREVPVRGLQISELLVDDDPVSTVPASSTVNVSSIVQTDDDEFVNNGRVRLSQTRDTNNDGNIENVDLADVDARTSTTNVNNGKYTFENLQVGPRGIDTDGDGIGEQISQLTFTGYQYNDTDGDNTVNLEDTEVTRAAAEQVELSVDDTLNVTYVAANTSEYAGFNANDTFTLTRGVKYDQIAFELTQDGSPVDLTEGVDGTTVPLDDLADAQVDGENLVQLTTTDNNGNTVYLTVDFDEAASNASAGYYVVDDIESSGAADVESSNGGAPQNGDTFVFDSNSVNEDTQQFTLGITTADLADTTNASSTGEFVADNPVVDGDVYGVAGDSVPYSANDTDTPSNGVFDDLAHDQTADLNTNRTNISSPTVGIERTYRINATVTDALGTPLNGSHAATQQVRVLWTGSLDGGNDAASFSIVSGPDVTRVNSDEVRVQNANGTFQYDIEVSDAGADGSYEPTFDVETRATTAPDGQGSVSGTPAAQNPVVEVYGQNGGALPVNEQTGNEILANDLANNLRIEAFPAAEEGFVLPDGITYTLAGTFAETDVGTSTQHIDQVETSQLATEGYEVGQIGFMQATPTGTGTSFATLQHGGTDVLDTNGDTIEFDVLSSNRETIITLDPVEPTSEDNVTVITTDADTGDVVDQVTVTVESPSGDTTTVLTDADGEAVVPASFLTESGTYDIDTARAGYGYATQSFTVALPEASVTIDDQSYTNSTDTVTVASATYEGGDFAVAIHNEAGDIIGWETLTQGSHSDVTVTLDEELTANETVTAMLHEGVDEPAIVRGGEPVADSATVTITEDTGEIPPVVGDNAPTDPDGDGQYEDVNGDGTADVVDVQALFANYQDDVIQNNLEAFDFNNDGAVNVVDVQRLFVELV